MYQEGVRRAIGLPGEEGQIVEGELEAFFSLDLSSILDSNCFDPQVLIQGRLSCKTVRAVGTIIIIETPACILSHGSLHQPQLSPLQMRNQGLGGQLPVKEGPGFQ